MTSQLEGLCLFLSLAGLVGYHATAALAATDSAEGLRLGTAARIGSERLLENAARVSATASKL